MRVLLSIILLGAGLVWPSLSWSIGHVGTRKVVSQNSQFEAYFFNPKVTGVKTIKKGQRLQFNFYTFDKFSFSDVILPIYISELSHRLPEQSQYTLNDLVEWLELKGFESREARNPCVIHFSKVVNNTQTWVLFWDKGKGVHMVFPDQSEILKTATDFVNSIRLMGDSCPN